MKNRPVQGESGAHDCSEQVFELAMTLRLAALGARLHTVDCGADGGFELKVTSSTGTTQRIDIGPPDGRPAWRALPSFSLGYGGNGFDDELRTLLEHLAGVLTELDFGALSRLAKASAQQESDRDDPWHEVDELLASDGWLDTCQRFDPRPIRAELEALVDEQVGEPQRGDDPKAEKRWSSLALRTRSGVCGVTWAMTPEAGPDGEPAPWRWTRLAACCPKTIALLDDLVEMETCGSIHALILAPGGRVELHADEPEKRCSPSLSLAVEHPDGCRFAVENSSGQLVTVPFESGAAILVNVAHRHSVSHSGDRDRVHIVARGRPRVNADALVGNHQSER